MKVCLVCRKQSSKTTSFHTQFGTGDVCPSCVMDLQVAQKNQQEIQRSVVDHVLKTAVEVDPKSGDENWVARPPDDVNHPTHYNQGKIEVIEFIEDQKLGFCLGNAVKYVARAGKKLPEKSHEDLDREITTKDLKKAIWYINRYIETLKPNPRRPNDMDPA